MALILSGIQAEMAASARLLEDMLDDLLPEAHGLERGLFEAMRYASLNGGKRLRPFLALSSARLFNVAESCALRVAAAVECVHCYSLIHDDLPAMDNDKIRRGKPTTHIAFDEATAILAGDALLTLAFEILANPATHDDPTVRSNLVLGLARAAGGHGMVGGQMMDMVAEQQALDVDAVTRLQRLKTGALFAFACEAGAILARINGAPRRALHAYAHDLGLAFQITDDLLDVEGREEEVGKKLSKDSKAGKNTFVSVLGLEGARDQARMLIDQAVAHLAVFDQKAEPLRAVARYLLLRRA